jgi:hypothetical protein
VDFAMSAGDVTMKPILQKTEYCQTHKRNGEKKCRFRRRGGQMRHFSAISVSNKEQPPSSPVNQVWELFLQLFSD